MDVTIRRATIQDAPAVAEVINSVVQEEALTDIYPPVTAEQQVARLKGLGPRSTVLVAEVDGAILGVQTIDPFADNTQAMDHVAIMRTFVHKNFRRQGAGKKLVEATVRFCQEQRYEKVIIYVRIGNSAAQTFYRKLGFIPKMMLERQIKIKNRYDDIILMDLFVPEEEKPAVREAVPQVVVPPEPIVPPRPEPQPVSVPLAEAQAVPPPIFAPAPEPVVAEEKAAIDPVVGAVTVRRAKRQDLKTLTAIMKGTIRWRTPPSEEEVLDMIFDKGYWLAMSRKGGGVTGWRAENLVMCIDDFYVYPPQFYPQIGGPLLETVEEEAKALVCEVAIVFFEKQIAPEAVRFFESHGYQRQELDELFTIWKQVAQELLTENRFMLVKKLREKRIMRPI